MNREQLMNVLIAPHVTEKTSLAMQNHNQYTFRVQREATKVDIKQAVELMFDVKVSAVQVVNEPGKSRRFGKTVGRTQDWKKAYVSLAANIAGYPHGRQDRPLAPVQGRPVPAVDRAPEQDGCSQPFRPHHHTTRWWRLASEVPRHRFQA
jgi:large subunit ribosomal protein L23